MHPYQNSSLAITGFIVDEGCLYAVLKGTDGDTKLYDKQALAWIISEARKAGTKCAELRKRSSGIDHSQYPIVYRDFGPGIHQPIREHASRHGFWRAPVFF